MLIAIIAAVFRLLPYTAALMLHLLMPPRRYALRYAATFRYFDSRLIWALRRHIEAPLSIYYIRRLMFIFAACRYCRLRLLMLRYAAARLQAITIDCHLSAPMLRLLAACRHSAMARHGHDGAAA